MITGDSIVPLTNLSNITKKKTIVSNCHLQNVNDFLSRYSDYAIEVENKYNIPAIAMIAQSALETGWGKMILWVYCNGVRICSNNMFNIKVHNDNGILDWQGQKGTAHVNEFVSGKESYIDDWFRVYKSAKESFDDYGNYITTRKKQDGSLRYQSSFGITDANNYIDEITKNGYATSPIYADEIKKIILMLEVKEI